MSTHISIAISAGLELIIECNFLFSVSASKRQFPWKPKSNLKNIRTCNSLQSWVLGPACIKIKIFMVSILPGSKNETNTSLNHWDIQHDCRASRFLLCRKLESRFQSELVVNKETVGFICEECRKRLELVKKGNENLDY